MLGPDLPEMPVSLKRIQQYLKIATTHDQRDPVVSYWCRVYAFKLGIQISTHKVAETNFLTKIMDWLETTKAEMRDNEAITNDVAAQAHLENWALKLFLFADKNDRAHNFGKNVVQSFFTAGLLYDVIADFGELSEVSEQNRKYAKWKAAYIHNCLKNGETPVSGPAEEPLEDEDPDRGFGEALDNGEGTTNVSADVPPPTKPDRTPSLDLDSATVPANDPLRSTYTPSEGNVEIGSPGFAGPLHTGDGAELSMEQIGKAQKFIKWAGSALNYDDVPTACMNLRKALHLLSTGQDPA